MEYPEFIDLAHSSGRRQVMLIERPGQRKADWKPTGLFIGDRVIGEVEELHYMGISTIGERGEQGQNCWLSIDPGYRAVMTIPLKGFKNSKDLIGRKFYGIITLCSLAKIMLRYAGEYDELDEGLNRERSGLLKDLSGITAEIEKVQQPLVARLREVLAGLAGRNFAEEGKTAVVKQLQTMLRRLGMKVVCPKTGKPGTLRLKRAGRNNQLVFEIQIKEKGRYTSHFSSARLPNLFLTNEPDEENS